MTPPRQIGEAEPAQTAEDEDVVHAYWLTGGGCDGCSIAVTGATDPGVEDLLADSNPQLPRVELYHPVLAVEHGEDYVDRRPGVCARG